MDAQVIVEDGRVPWELVVPASVLNTRATVRLLTEDEADQARWAGRG